MGSTRIVTMHYTVEKVRGVFFETYFLTGPWVKQRVYFVDSDPQTVKMSTANPSITKIVMKYWLS